MVVNHINLHHHDHFLIKISNYDYNKILNIIISEKKGKKEIQDMKEIKSRIDKLMQ